MSPHSSGNQSIMDLPAGYTAESLNTHLSTLDSPAIQGMDQLREGLSGLSHQQLVNAYIDCMQEREIAQTENLSFRNEAEQSRQKILDLEERLADQESVVREAQESAFALMASKISIAENDDKIYSKLRMIRMQWKNFAKKWASKSMTDIPNKEHVSIRRMVNTWVAPDEYQSHDGIWATENDRKAPSILLNTVLAHFISSNIIRKPFTSAYNLKGGTKTVLYDDVTIMNSLDELYAIKIKGLLVEKYKIFLSITDMTQKTMLQPINGGLKRSPFLTGSSVTRLLNLRHHSKPWAEDLNTMRSWPAVSSARTPDHCIVNAAKRKELLALITSWIYFARLVIFFRGYGRKRSISGLWIQGFC